MNDARTRQSPSPGAPPATPAPVAAEGASGAVAAAREEGGAGEAAELARLRADIDAVDHEILAALNRRAALVRAVGEWKRRSQRGVYSASRERDLVEALVAANPGPFPDEAIAPVFREIVSATRSLEARLRVAFIGPEGTFSHVAARRAFGAQVDFVPSASIADALASVDRGEADHAIVPVENTTEGVVTQSLDALLGARHPICAEHLLPISLDLLSKSGRLPDVRRVTSHPQPLAQCRTWLERNLPVAERMPASSTAAAALLASKEDDVAAIGNRLLAELHGLRVVAASIEDRRDNTTRFVVVGGEPPAPSGDDLTSLAYTVKKSESGALFRLLEPFAARGVNLTSIQARPLEGRPFEYVFFVDLEGHASEPRVHEAHEEAAARASSHRLLGSFPRARAAGVAP